LVAQRRLVERPQHTTPDTAIAVDGQTQGTVHGSTHGGHDELVALADVFRPALHDGFLLGVETHTFFAVGMHVAEQAALPAAESVPGHRYRNGYVHTHHTDLDTACELARRIAVAGEAGHAVAELVTIHQVDRLGKIADMHAHQHGAEYFFLV